jgi:hypothetical protein
VQDFYAKEPSLRAQRSNPVAHRWVASLRSQ